MLENKGIFSKFFGESFKGKIRLIILCAIFIFVIILVIIILSKFNDIRHHRVPTYWKSKVKDVVSESAQRIKEAIDNSESDKALAYHNAVEANAFLNAATKLVGTDALPKLTGFDIPALKSRIEDFYDKYVRQPSENRKKNKHRRNIDNNPSLRDSWLYYTDNKTRNTTNKEGLTDVRNL